MNIDAHPVTIRMAAAALGRAALFDDRITDGDAARVAAWAEALEPHQLPQADVLTAVTRYYDAPGVPTIKVGDLISVARGIRRDRAEREKATEAHNAWAAPNPALGGLPIPTDGKPVWAAYDEGKDGKAIDRSCHHCQADPGEACVNMSTGATSKIPCLVRLTGKAKLA